MTRKPGVAAALSLAGGAIVSLSGISLLFVLYNFRGMDILLIAVNLSPIVGFPLLVVFGSVGMLLNARRYRTWATLVLASSVVSSLGSPPLLYYYPPWGILWLFGVSLGILGGTLAVGRGTHGNEVDLRREVS